MANNRNSKQKTKSSDNKKWFITIGAFVLILALVISAAIGTSGFKQRNPKLWFNSWGKHVEISAPADEAGTQPARDFVAVDNNGNVMKSGRVYTMPKGFTFVNELAEENAKRTTRASAAEVTVAENDSVTVRATITPANADDQRVTWESSDASTVSVTPTSAGSLTATITRLSNLVNGKITITCRSVDKPEIFATCEVGQLINGNNLELTGRIVENPDKIVFGQSYNFYAKWEDNSPGVGTILGETTNIYHTWNLTRGFMSAVDSELNKLGCSYTLLENDSSIGGGTSGTLPATPYEAFYSMDEIDIDTFNRAFKLAVMNYTGAHVTLTIEADYTFNGKTYQSDSIDINYQFDVSNIWIPVSGLDIGNDVVFE